jgi:hypothetical protein
MKKKLVINIIHHTNELSNLELKNLQNLLNLNKSKYDVVFTLPIWCKETKIVQEFKQVRFHFVDNKILNSNKSYNKFLISKEYYINFKNYNYLLLYQLDTWVFSLQLENILLNEFDFIGAPILSEDRHFPIEIIDGCNGGVSIRKVDTFIKILDREYIFSLYDLYSHIGFGNKINQPFKRLLKILFSRFIFFTKPNVLWPFHLNEDLFWTVIIPNKFSDFKISDFKTSMHFCFDQEPQFLYNLNNNELPLFAHAIEKYDFKFWEPFIQINDNHIK